jgi:hypothetical protein
VKETIKARKIIDPGFWSLEKGRAGKVNRAERLSLAEVPSVKSIEI